MLIGVVGLSSIDGRVAQAFQHVQVLGVVELRLHYLWVFITVEL